jgi:hypothetical protein
VPLRPLVFRSKMCLPRVSINFAFPHVRLVAADCVIEADLGYNTRVKVAMNSINGSPSDTFCL